MTTPADGPIGVGDYVVVLAFFALTFGLMQSIVQAQRHLVSDHGMIRVLGLTLLISTILFGGLMFVPAGGWGHRWAGILAFAALIAALGLLEAVAPSRRFGPVSTQMLVILGTLVLKASDALR